MNQAAATGSNVTLRRSMFHATSRLRYGKKFAFSQPLRDGMLSVPRSNCQYLWMKIL